MTDTTSGPGGQSKPVEISREEKAQAYGERMRPLLDQVAALMDEAAKDSLLFEWDAFKQGEDGKFTARGLHILAVERVKIELK